MYIVFFLQRTDRKVRDVINDKIESCGDKAVENNRNEKRIKKMSVKVVEAYLDKWKISPKESPRM